MTRKERFFCELAPEFRKIVHGPASDLSCTHGKNQIGKAFSPNCPRSDTWRYRSGFDLPEMALPVAEVPAARSEGTCFPEAFPFQLGGEDSGLPRRDFPGGTRVRNTKPDQTIRDRVRENPARRLRERPHQDNACEPPLHWRDVRQKR